MMIDRVIIKQTEVSLCLFPSQQIRMIEETIGIGLAA